MNNYIKSGGKYDNGHFARQSNDIVIAFVKHLDTKRIPEKTFKYNIHSGKTGTLIKPIGVLDKGAAAHEVGHILGASHGKLQSLH